MGAHTEVTPTITHELRNTETIFGQETAENWSKLKI
jgi:hypothetical protein